VVRIKPGSHAGHTGGGEINGIISEIRLRQRLRATASYQVLPTTT
jgi:hypothetical protein